MKKLVLFALALGTSAAFARPDTTKLTCAAAQSIVAQAGSIVLSTGPGLYDRYVANGNYAGSFETAVASYVPTKDNAECFIGYVIRTGRAQDNSGSNVVSPIRTCKEGAVETFTKLDVSGRTVTFQRTCVNGRFFPKSNVKALVCKEGSSELFSEQDVFGRNNDVWKTCVNGKWVK